MDNTLKLVFLLSLVCLCVADKRCVGKNCIKKRSIDDPARRCTPGDSWNESCNVCMCSTKGYPICTDRNCHLINFVSDNYSDCDPGSRWKVECNVCFCTLQGKPKCTEYSCGKKHRERRSNLRFRFSRRFGNPLTNSDEV